MLKINQIKTNRKVLQENVPGISAKSARFVFFGLPCHLLTLNNLIRRLIF